MCIRDRSKKALDVLRIFINTKLITKLHFNRIYIYFSDIKHVAEVLKSRKTLTALSIINSSIEKKDRWNIVKALQVNRSLIQLNVSGLSLIHICRCRRIERCRSRWSPYH
eukprot:TRINITY_DN24946_c0_g1_i1.p2 TRINITY_DN24946_c0_g1~~TRINITY_DN24946_c0_g1_i1.p2  ORF type:complete len:110 (+),score=7.95 TRINITY_DN24946_c0_g1_i1:67-396(+)